MIWFAFVILILIAILMVLPPLLSRPKIAAHARDLAVYRDQLKEVEADLERGLISQAEAEAARTEIKRRILAVPQASANADTKAPSRAIAFTATGAVIAVALATYLTLGRPDLPSHVYDHAAETDPTPDQMLAEINTMVEGLAKRLETDPNNAQGWRMLGWSYVQLGRVKEGIDALAHAIKLDPNNAALRAQYGEALVQQADGKVTPDAEAAFEEALRRDAKDPRARFYKGLSLLQAGKGKEALALWNDVIRDAPADADWLPGLRAQAHELATKLEPAPKAP